MCPATLNHNVSVICGSHTLRLPISHSHITFSLSRTAPKRMLFAVYFVGLLHNTSTQLCNVIYGILYGCSDVEDNNDVKIRRGPSIWVPLNHTMSVTIPILFNIDLIRNSAENMVVSHIQTWILHYILWIIPDSSNSNQIHIYLVWTVAQKNF